MRRKPRFGRTAQAALLLGADHLERVAAPGAALRLDLAEHQPPAAARDQVDLVAASPDVRAEDPVAAKPVVRSDGAGASALASRVTSRVAERLERAAVDVARPVLAHDAPSARA